MSKVSVPTLRAGFLINANIRNILIKYFENDQPHAFMNSLTSTPEYWKKLKSEILALVKCQPFL